ncbi:MAG: response regulator [Rhodospirillales bacterium]|nr:response regulator [Rhodospirillales bacterium]MCB9973235.1 response regulator [Rhodospirillales bacterium]MCB9980735.1 response regulator [Rhodospirillales bacterium]
MLLSVKKLLIRFYTWVVLLVIVIFGAAAFYSCLQILQQEERAISSYKLKHSKLQKLQQDFNDLESQIIMYFDEKANHHTSVDLEKISVAFSTFQDSFIFFNQTEAHPTGALKSDELLLVGDIQRLMLVLVPYIRDVAQDQTRGKHMDVLDVMRQIQKRLQEFGLYQTRTEEEFLSEESLRERRTKIFLSVLLLSLSGLFLILFLVYKHEQLERTNREKQEIFDISNQRIIAIESSSDGIAIMNADKTLLYMNKALSDMHGIPAADRERYLGKSWKKLYNQKGQDYIEDSIYPFLDRQGEWRGETRIMRKDGKLIEADLSLTLLPDEKGMIYTARDITERRQAEDKNRELQAQIYQAQKMEAVGRLAGGVAHDFNNVLAAIMGYAEFLSEDLSADPKLKTYADNILMAGQKGRALIDQMLAFSRRKESHKFVMDLHEVMREVISMISVSLPKTIELQTDFYHDDIAYINGDPSQIAQAIMNIMVNAVDAMEEERGTLEISLSLVEPDEETFEGMLLDDYLRETEMPPVTIHDLEPGHVSLEMGRFKREQKYFQISITDTGTGMTRSVLEHIFEPFFTTKPVDKGTGLGMANVHGAIVAHHAVMNIDSTLMEGTTFELFFPKVDYIDNLSMLKDGNDTDHHRDFSQVRVLLVDDQMEVLTMMETLLIREGFQCTSCQDSLKALTILRNRPDSYDLVVTDQNMPKMTGLELADQTQQINPELPFIIISGYSYERLQEIKKSYPSIKYCIQKPARKESLLAAISDVLKDKTPS